MSKIIDTADEQARKTAAIQAHGFVYVDKVLKAKTDGYLVQLTLGWATPNEAYAPVATVAVPVPFAKELAEELMAVYELAAKKRAEK